MTFTPQQIAAIERIIDARLAALRVQTNPSSLKRWHSTLEIRQLITDNLIEMLKWFGDDDFDIAVLRHFLSRKTVMREGDLEIPNPDHQKVTRWDAQVLNAINPAGWPDCPIISSSKRRHYRLSPTIDPFTI